MKTGRGLRGVYLIWTLFEAQLLDESASSRKIVAKSRDWQKNHGIDDVFIEDHLEYFKDRYVEDGNFSNSYEHLNLRQNDNEKLVKGVLLGNIDDPASKLACCLIIVLRYRNNYFHGIKWAYQFQEQQENFERACCLLTWSMDRYAR